MRMPDTLFCCKKSKHIVIYIITFEKTNLSYISFMPLNFRLVRKGFPIYRQNTFPKDPPVYKEQHGKNTSGNPFGAEKADSVHIASPKETAQYA